MLLLLKTFSPAAWSIAGLALSMVGVLFLFRFGMPYETRGGGAVFLIAQETDEAGIRREALYGNLGWLGLFAVILGTIFQMIGSYIS